jgi:2-amino-4-hydroxy-6-hydroxymethyldihydropteridine diphosphokinase
VGLGANLGDRLATLRAAAGALAGSPEIAVLARSSVWETAPVGGPPQPDYLNAALLVRTGLEPADLLAVLLGVERRFGRVRTVRDAPRTLDLDLLWMEGEALRTPELEVPHPRLRERAFALAPLVEVLPDARDPSGGERYADLLARASLAGVARREPL